MLRTERCCVGLSCRRTSVTFLLISHKPQRWSGKWIYRQKAHESGFAMIGLPNGNDVKFSNTNRKYFTAGDPIAFPIVKMGNETPLPQKTSLSLCTTWTPSNTAIPRPTARTIPNRSSDGWGTVAHRRRKVPLVTMAHKFVFKSTPSRGPIPKPHYLPHPWTRPTYDAKRNPDPIRRFSTTHWIDRPTHVQTDRPTDRPRETRATRPNNDYYLLRQLAAKKQRM